MSARTIGSNICAALAAAVCLVPASAWGGDQKPAKRPVDALYQLYNSTSTPAAYKARLKQMIRFYNPKDPMFHASPAAVSASPMTAQSLPQTDPSFKLREVYAYPNPAKAGKNPTIHVEVGVADSVDIQIYDLSGHEVHATTLRGAPQVIADNTGRGPQYAYEYVWDASGVGSGVYVYTVTARKAGKPPLKAAKKLALIK